MSNEIYEAIEKNIIIGHLDQDDEGYGGDMEGKPGVLEMVDGALKSGLPAQDILEVFGRAMDKVGEKYESGEYMIPDMLASAECVGEAMDLLEPHLTPGAGDSKGCFVIATVKDDLHDIGKNIVVILLKAAGYKVIDLGNNIGAGAIVKAAKQHGADYIGLSALLTTTMAGMETVIEGLKQEGLRDRVKVLIGGAPTSPEFAEKIGADLHCLDAFDAIDKLKAVNA